MKKTEQIKIEKGIPVPAKRGAGEVLQTFRKMEVGDSIVIPIKKRTAIGGWANHAKIKVASRALDELTVRVWRIA